MKPSFEQFWLTSCLTQTLILKIIVIIMISVFVCIVTLCQFIGDKEINQNHSLQRLKLIRGLPFSAHHLNNLGWHLAWWHHIHQYHHYLNHHQNLCKDVVVIVISSPPLDFVVDRYIVNTPWLLAPCLTSTRCWWWGGGMRRDNIYTTTPKSFAGTVCGQFFLTKS